MQSVSCTDGLRFIGTCDKCLEARSGTEAKKSRQMGRDFIFGLVGILAAIPVYWGLKALRVKHTWDFEELAGLMVMAVPMGLLGVLLFCRLFGLWPFSN